MRRSLEERREREKEDIRVVGGGLSRIRTLLSLSAKGRMSERKKREKGIITWGRRFIVGEDNRM